MMDDQFPFGFASQGLRNDAQRHASFDGCPQPGPARSINSAPTNETARYLSLIWRFCHDEHFANIVDEWNSFEVPQRMNEIRQAVHFAPPAFSLEQLQDTSQNSMQRWAYRLLTLSSSRIEPNMPVCISHTMALQELIAWWKLDGSQFCGLRARQELFDPVQAEERKAVRSCRFARQIMCDMLWLELCHLRGEWNSIERATRLFQARVAEYTQPTEGNRLFSSIQHQRAEQRRIVKEPQNDGATVQQPAIPEACKWRSQGSTLAVCDVESEHHKSAVQSDEPSQRSKCWSWSNPFLQVTHKRHGSKDALRHPDGIKGNDVIDPFRSLPYRPEKQAPINQIKSSCATPERQHETMARSMLPSVLTTSVGYQHEANQENDISNSAGCNFVEVDSHPRSQSTRVSSGSHDKEMGTSHMTRRSSTAERWHEQSTAKERHVEAVNPGAENIELKAAIIHDWLEMPDADEDSD